MTTSPVLLSGVIGQPISHSLSPVFQNAAFAAVLPAGAYLSWEVAPPDDAGFTLDVFLDLVRHNPQQLAARATHPPAIPDGAILSLLGFNATLPHKETLLQRVDILDPLAAAIGAINTIVVQEGLAPKTVQTSYSAPQLLGYNTDAPGLRRALVGGLRRGGIAPQSVRRLLLLGASGAARGAAYGLLADYSHLGLSSDDGLHIEDFAIANRSIHRAEALVAQLTADPLVSRPERSIRLAGATSVEPFDVIVNATSLGVSGGDVADAAIVQHALAQAAPDALFYDLVYRKDGLTPFLDLARRTHPQARLLLDGLTMLLWQGALAFERWTGVAAPLSVMAQSVGCDPAFLEL